MHQLKSETEKLQEHTSLLADANNQTQTLQDSLNEATAANQEAEQARVTTNEQLQSAQVTPQSKSHRQCFTCLESINFVCTSLEKLVMKDGYTPQVVL